MKHSMSKLSRRKLALRAEAVTTLVPASLSQVVAGVVPGMTDRPTFVPSVLNGACTQ
jgi:hypothetical protein